MYSGDIYARLPRLGLCFSREISNLEYGGSVEERGGQHWECIYGQGEGEKYYPNQFILARQYQIIRKSVFIDVRWL